jgi:flagellar hook-associated protein 2
MRAESMRMDRLTRRRQMLAWRQEDLRGAMRMIDDFRTNNTRINPGDDSRALTNMQLWNTVAATVTRNGEASTGITVQTNQDSRIGNFGVRVDQVARADFAVGAARPASYRNQTMGDVLGAGAFTNGVATIRINNTNITVRENMTVQTAMETISRSNAGVTMRYDGLRGAFTLENTRTGASNQLNASGENAFNFLNHLGLTSGTYAPGDYIFNPVTRVVQQPVWGDYILDASDNRILIDPADPSLGYQREPVMIPNPDYPGSGGPYVQQTVSVTQQVPYNHGTDFTRTVDGTYEDRNGVLFRSTGVRTPGGINLGDSIDRGHYARDAQITLFDSDNVELGTRTSSTNTFEDVDGLRVTVSGANVGDIFNVNTHRNVDNVMSAIRDFVNNYNALIRSLNAMHTTARPRSGSRTFFEPLTDAQRREMSDSEIARWEEQARTGMLHRDPTLRQLQDNIRRSMMEPVNLPDGSRIFLTQIGITTGYAPTHAERNLGLLQIDEEQLRRALEENPDQVQALFTNTNDSNGNFLHGANAAQRNARAPQVGLAFRLDDILVNAAVDHRGPLMQQIGRAGSADERESIVARRLREYDSRIEQMQQWLLRRENTLFAQFARMEQAMAQSHAQMDSLWAFAGM